jgi:hypothetical protein
MRSLRAFSLNLRQRVPADYRAGLSLAELGRKYSTRAEWVRQFIRRYEATLGITADVFRFCAQHFAV